MVLQLRVVERALTTESCTLISVHEEQSDFLASRELSASGRSRPLNLRSKYECTTSVFIDILSNAQISIPNIQRRFKAVMRNHGFVQEDPEAQEFLASRDRINILVVTMVGWTT
jgi:hypothetical protein